MTNTTLNVCRGELHKVWKVEHLEATLAEDNIAYRESIRDVGSSTSVLGPSTSDPCPSMS